MRWLIWFLYEDLYGQYSNGRIHIYDIKGFILIWYYTGGFWWTPYIDVQLSFMNIIKCASVYTWSEFEIMKGLWRTLGSFSWSTEHQQLHPEDPI